VQPGAAGARARPPVWLFLAFAAAAQVGWALQRARGGGLSPSEVEAVYLGVDGVALGAAALWEEVHAAAFVHGFVLFMLGALLAASRVAPRAWPALFAVAAASAFADLAAPFVIVGVSGAGALRVVTFCAAAATAALLLLVTAVARARERRDG
jgi:hypothetical protein